MFGLLLPRFQYSECIQGISGHWRAPQTSVVPCLRVLELLKMRQQHGVMTSVREHNWAVLRFLQNAGQVPTIPVFRGSTLPRPPATPTHHATIYSAFLDIMADMWCGLWSNLCQSGRTSHLNHPTESIAPFRDDPIPITELPDIPYEANRYSVFLRTQEEVKPHLELLYAYVRSCPIDTHDNIGFMVIEPLPEEGDCERCYSAMLPPIILRWVQFRPEAESIHRETRQGMFAELCVVRDSDPLVKIPLDWMYRRTTRIP
ncbi:hypothetical protein B0H13DRAFT_1866676 [Mycena leptocephala]|nr:hypothetical protein B0H13DRAFT_1866676 [Mycena leptocephala]